MKRIILALTLASTAAFAGFGGSRSSGGSRSFSSPSRSSFGGSRSYSAPSRSYSAPSRSYSAPSPSRNSGGYSFGGARRSSQPATITRPSAPSGGGNTVINNHNYDSGYGYGNSFMQNLMFWHIWTQPQTVVVQQPVTQYVDGSAGQPVTANGEPLAAPAPQPEKPSHVWHWIVLILLIAAGYGIYKHWQTRKRSYR